MELDELSVLRHVLRLPQQVPWTGQPGRTTGLERLGFYGDTWAALRAGPADYGPRYEPDYGPRYAPDRRATPRVGPPGSATRRAAGPR